MIGFIVIGWWISISITSTFNCIPIEKIWNPEVQGTCLSQYRVFLGAAIPNVVTDALLLVVPLPLLWKLQTSWRNKISVMAISFVVIGKFYPRLF